MACPQLRVLLLEDDEDDYILVRDLLGEVSSTAYHLDWAPDYDAASKALAENRYDVLLLDYHLGDRNGIDVLRELNASGFTQPVILLTGQGDYEVDVGAMKAGASDYLVKGQINSPLLDRSIRYAMERKHVERKLRHLSAQLLTVQEDERKSIARELHDSVGQSIAAIKFGIENTLNMLKLGDLPSITRSLEIVIPVIQNLIDEVRNIYMDLRPSVLDDLGIIATIEWYCRKVQTAYPDIVIEKCIAVKETDIPDSTKTVIFRVMQESLDNIARHSGADHVDLSLLTREDTIELLIQDDGAGFDLDSALFGDEGRRGHGLASMQERVELSNGAFAIESVTGQGTTIKASWPLLCN